MSGIGGLDVLGPGISDPVSIGVVIETFFYGLYCFIFGQFVQVHRKKNKEERSILVYPLVVLFLLSTLYFMLNLPQTFWLVLRPGTHQNFIWNVDVISVAIYGVADFISQAILIYRCWIMWHHIPSLVIIPSILAVTLLGIILVLVVELCRQFQFKSLSHMAPWAIPLGISSICISLALNAIVTGLLVFRITTAHIRFRRSMDQADRRTYDLFPLISILIETGMMTFVSQLLLVIVLCVQSNAFVVISSPMVMIYGMTPTIVVVRVATGISYDGDSRIRSSMVFATGHGVGTEVITAET